MGYLLGIFLQQDKVKLLQESYLMAAYHQLAERKLPLLLNNYPVGSFLQLILEIQVAAFQPPVKMTVPLHLVAELNPPAKHHQINNQAENFHQLHHLRNFQRILVHPQAQGSFRPKKDQLSFLLKPLQVPMGKVPWIQAPLPLQL